MSESKEHSSEVKALFLSMTHPTAALTGWLAGELALSEDQGAAVSVGCGHAEVEASLATNLQWTLIDMWEPESWEKDNAVNWGTRDHKYLQATVDDTIEDIAGRVTSAYTLFFLFGTRAPWQAYVQAAEVALYIVTAGNDTCDPKPKQEIDGWELKSSLEVEGRSAIKNCTYCVYKRQEMK